MATKEDEIPWFKSPIVLGMLAVFSLTGAAIGVAKYISEVKSGYEGEVEVRTESRIRASQVAEDAAKGAAFAECWPLGNCEGFTQLPIDDDQNRRLERIEKEIYNHHLFDREHCQAHRDAGETGCPAPAGIDPRCGLLRRGLGRLPRTCGDRPCTCSRTVQRWRVAPHLRG